MLRESFETWMDGKLLRLRPAEESEFGDIVELRAHPDVAPFQYDPGESHESVLRLFRELQEKDPEFQYCLYSITLDDRFIGSLICFRAFVLAWGPFCSGEVLPISAGWDLHPDFWGNGYMSAALSMAFGRLFELDEYAVIRCECFSINDRCIRLLGRLGFKSTRMPWTSKLAIKLSKWDFHRHLRFELTKDLFEHRTFRFDRIGNQPSEDTTTST